MTGVNDIRRSFLDYFASNSHEVVASSSLVPHNDPTLLFTNSGMVQFKNVFTGNENPGYDRAVTSQKCVRAGGKHNDLDNVGYTTRHHTFFEMLGNFSFGSYFKDVAIELAWKLVTEQFDLAPDRLMVTVYAEDEEAKEYWKKIAQLPDERIVSIGSDDNYWRMGQFGPCGPCSEIFFDHGEHIEGGPPGSANQDGDRFVEIWNLVFMQFEELSDGSRIDLPRPSIDTGMGLERIAAVLQGVNDNYATDLLRSIVLASAEISNVPADGEHSASHRIIADHVRACSFLVADGVLPANEGRGYVLRRIMRRAMRHAHLIGYNEPLLWQLVATLVREMGVAFPELSRAQELIIETLNLEETRFRQMLDRGLHLLGDELNKLPNGASFPGEIAFRLYDTFGFPLDLTQDALRAEGRSVDVDGFNACMEKQRSEARAAWIGSGEVTPDTIWYALRERIGSTEFLGYDQLSADGKVTALLCNGEELEEGAKGSQLELLMNQTPFYGEAGGQVGDSGLLSSGDDIEIEINNTGRRLGEIWVHFGTVTKGTVRKGDILRASVDSVRRAEIRSNHSATHLLHAALRQVLGGHVTQKGSLVAPDRLRFDISHAKPITEAEIGLVEDMVNSEIRSNHGVTTAIMNPEEAVNKGALALFGEKYGDEVRVISMGSSAQDNRRYSVELCGGTHVKRTGDIGFFKIISEGAVAAGVRRLEAVTGVHAENYVRDQSKVLRLAAASLKTAPSDINARISTLLEQRRKLERQLSEARNALTAGSTQLPNEIREVNGVQVFTMSLQDVAANELRGMIDNAKKTLQSGIVVIAASSGGKVRLVVGITEDLTKRYNAVDLVRIGSEVLGGQGGGGRADFAQAGGPDESSIDAAFLAIERHL